MIVQFARWGNSLAVRIPASLAKELGAIEGLAADISISDGCLVVKPANPRKAYKLEDLLVGITPENIHPETGTGLSYGEEGVEYESILPESGRHHLS